MLAKKKILAVKLATTLQSNTKYIFISHASAENTSLAMNLLSYILVTVVIVIVANSLHQTLGVCWAL